MSQPQSPNQEEPLPKPLQKESQQQQVQQPQQQVRQQQQQQEQQKQQPLNQEQKQQREISSVAPPVEQKRSVLKSRVRPVLKTQDGGSRATEPDAVNRGPPENRDAYADETKRLEKRWRQSVEPVEAQPREVDTGRRQTSSVVKKIDVDKGRSSRKLKM